MVLPQAENLLRVAQGTSDRASCVWGALFPEVNEGMWWDVPPSKYEISR